MSFLIKHFYNSQKINRLLNQKGLEELGKNLYWYDLSIKFASSKLGFIKVLFWRILKKISNFFFFFLKKKNSAYSFNYQKQNPKNYGVESIYYKNVKKKLPDHSNPSIWNFKILKSKPWFEIDKWSHYLENNYNIIKNEFVSSRCKILEHPGNQMLAEKGEWSSITLIGAKGKNMKYESIFPDTFSILKDMPVNETFGFVAFSKLTPGTHLKAHTGSSNLRLRYHLGINVPEPNLVKIRVGNETRSWEEGKCIIFDDSFEHEVNHNGTKDRIVFIVDLWHPQINSHYINTLKLDEFKNFGKI